MTRRKKQLLGTVGLAFVAAVTAVAACLPVPDAKAEQWAGDVTVKVTVEEAEPTPPDPGPGGETPGGQPSTSLPKVNIEGPTDLSVWLWGKGGVPVKTAYKQSNLLVYQLSCYHDNKTVFENEEIARRTVNGSGTDTFTLTDQMVLDAVAKAKEAEKVAAENGIRLAARVTTTTTEYLEYDFRLAVVAYGAEGRTANDAVRFMYREVVVNVTEVVDEKGDPTVELETSKNVHSLVLQVYGTNSGNPVFMGNDGVEHPIVITREELEKGDFKTRVLLEMSKWGVVKGTYDLVTVAYDADGKVLSINTNSFEYDPDVNVPNTGSIFGNLNISKVDYVITGVVAFGAVAMFLVYLIVRKSRR